MTALVHSFPAQLEALASGIASFDDDDVNLITTVF
jgi:hypothetical protein